MKFNRKKTGRIIAITFAVLAVILAVAVWRLGEIAEGVVNNVAPKLLGVPVSVEDVDISPLRGMVRVKNVEIGNPEGFDSPYLFHMDRLDIDVAVRDLFKGVCHITGIHIIGPHVWYHQKISSSNLTTFMGMLEERFPPPDTKSEKAKTVSKEEKQAMPVIIDYFLLDEGTIGIKMGAGFEIPLLKVELHDIGKNGSFVAGQVFVVIMKAIVNSVASAVTSVGGLAVDGVTAVGEAAVQGVAAAGDAAVKGVTSVISGIGSLFSGSETNSPPAE